MKVAIIGSGMAGLATAYALLERGITPTILDVGEFLDPKRRAIVTTFHDSPRASWSETDYSLISQNPTIGKRGLPKKLHFGSDYIYANNRTFAPLKSMVSGRVPFPTFAKGGFSNIWGGAVLPVNPSDMTDWPIGFQDLEPYFKKVANYLPICGGEGTLSRSFPLFKEEPGCLDPGPQGTLLLEDLNRVKNTLFTRNMLYGKARLSVYTDRFTPDGVLPCVGCGECFVGCVYGSIFSTIPVLSDLIRKNRIEYRPNTAVRTIREEDGKAILGTIDVATDSQYEHSYDAVFVAAGPINSTRILLQSKKIYDHSVFMKESQKFVIPLIRKHGAQTAAESPSATLASVFVEFKVQELSDHWIHMQVVPMNQMILDSVKLPGIDHPWGRRLWNPLLRRTMLGWCGLHSDHSSHVELRLRRGTDSKADLLEIDFEVSSHAKNAVRKATNTLLRNGMSFDTLFLPWLVRLSNPGSGTHCGGSFPMKKVRDGLFESDIFGRPFDWTSVFVVDSSVLPSIPGTTLAFTMMANAYRIGSQAPLSSGS